MDGVFGPFVIRQEDAAEPHLGLYDHDLPEHTVIINDWLVELSINRFTNHHYAGGDNKPASMLINGEVLTRFKKKIIEFFSDILTLTSVFHLL